MLLNQLRITWRICEALTRDCPQDDSAVRRRRTKGGTEEGFGPRAGHIRARGEPHIQSYQMWREQVADRPKHIRHVIRNGASLRATFLITLGIYEVFLERSERKIWVKEFFTPY